MADILPFRALRYQTARAGALSDLVAPPYDVISPTEQESLYARSPYNIVRLILGREADKYDQAASAFQTWQSEGILAPDDTAAFYVYRQTFADPTSGAPLPERLGLVCLLKLEEYDSGKVLRHENTLTAAKADRLDLLRSTHAQFESIYGLYSDPDSAVQSFLGEYDDREKIIERLDDQIGSSHSIERIADDSAVMTIRTLMADKPIFIADGHHRYETALNYRRENPSPAADYILITLTAFEDEGLLVLPTHRLIRGIDGDLIAHLPETLAQTFTVEQVGLDTLKSTMASLHQGTKVFGLILPDKNYLLTLTSDDFAALVPGAQSAAAKRLDVTLLHALVLEQRLGIDAAALEAGKQVAYTRDVTEAYARVESGEYQAAFLLARPSVMEVRDVSLAGDVMPQKSTFFFPKLLSGLLLRDLTAENPAEVLSVDP